MSALTLAEFEQAYADRSGLTVDQLHELGRRAVPCDCGDDICEGWGMGHASDDDPAGRGVKS